MKLTDHRMRFTRCIFIRCVAAIYLIAFLSAGSQMLGLYGHDGISPISAIVDNPSCTEPRLLLFLNYPTLFWFDASDPTLWAVPALGAGAALSAMLGILCGPMLAISWFLYLSIVTVGQEFMSFQWDILLLETGFLSVFLSTWRPLDFLFNTFALAKPGTLLGVKLKSWMVDKSDPSIIVIWLVRWLLFRLMFQSGMVKLDSMDETWRSLTAMTFHYETQPLPTPIGWFAHQMPVFIQKFSTGAVFFLELFVPFLIFMGRMPRIFAALGLVFLQVLIILTGNYCFFNWLTIAMCLLLVDDGILLKLVGKRLSGYIEKFDLAKPHKVRDRLKVAIIAPLAVLIVFLSSSRPLLSSLGGERAPVLLKIAVAICAPWHLVSSYGLFAVMTTSRPEISIEGSNDGSQWTPYVFKFKPGPLDRAPPIVAPNQPRLDWQMWFAALGTIFDNQWLVNFCNCLLRNSPEVIGLLESNPFPDKPPRYVRAIVYDYNMTDLPTLMNTGKWWTRKYKGVYMPAISLESEVEAGTIEQEP